MSNSTRILGELSRDDFDRLMKARSITNEQRQEVQEIMRHLARLVNVWQNARNFEAYDARTLHQKIGELEETLSSATDLCGSLRRGFTVDQRLQFGELLEEIEADTQFDSKGKAVKK